MNAFLESLLVWLADFLALATALLALSLVLRLVVRQPAARVTLAWGTWLGLVAIALLAATPAWPRYALADIAMAWKSQEAQIVQQPGANLLPEALPADFVLAETPVPVSDLEPVLLEVAAPPVAAPVEVPLRPLAAGSWLVSAVLGVAWILVGLARTRGLLARAVKAPLWVRGELVHLVGARRLPGLWASERVDSAIALGAIRPQIVLPQDSVAQTNRRAVKAALAHEWAHIRHGDLWLLALERLLLPLLALHPLFWWLRRSVRLDQELLADAAAAGEERVEYAEALLAWAKSAGSVGHGLAAVGMWENPNTLSRRVAMILDPKRPLKSTISRGWTIALAALLVPVVTGLSLVTLRPLVAQDEAARPAEAAVKVDEAAPPVTARSPYVELVGPLPKDPTTEATAIQLDLVVLTVDREKLAAADTTLEDEIAAATESRCRREASVVVSEIQAEEAIKLLGKLREHEALTVLSRPQVITLDGREARVHVGGEAPVLRIEETVNGEHERRVEYKEFGTTLLVRPKLGGERRELVTLELVAEQSQLVPPGDKSEEGAVARGVPGLVSHKFKLTAEVKLSDSLLVAESLPDEKQLAGAAKQQLLLFVTPVRAMRDPAAGKRGEKVRHATGAAVEAATAAEPEPGTAAAALLAREREARQQEIAALKRQIEALQAALAAKAEAMPPRPATPPPGIYFSGKSLPRDVRDRLEMRRFRIEGDAQELAKQFREWIDGAGLKEEAIAAIFSPHGAEVYAPADHIGEAAKFIASLGGKAIAPRDALAPKPQSARDTAAEPRPKPDSSGSAKDSQPIEVRLAELDLAQAKLAHEAAAKDYARSEELGTRSGAISQQERDASQIALAQAKIEVARAEAKLEAAQASASAHEAQTRPAVSAADRASRGELTADVDVARLELERAEQDWKHVEQLKAKGLITNIQMEQSRFDLEKARINLRRAEVRLSEAAPSAQPAVAAHRPAASSQTEVRLLELDVAEAQLALEDAEARLSHAATQRVKSPGSLSDAEFQSCRVNVERAKIQVQRAQVKLEAAKEGTGTRRR